MTFNEYTRELRKVNQKRKHKVQCSYRLDDAYKWIKKNKGLSIDEKTFKLIIKCMNSMFADNIVEGNTVILPNRFGKITLRKRVMKPKFIDGKLTVPQTIDWNTTLKLWHEDEESRKAKTFVYNTGTDVFNIWYEKVSASYKNMSYINFVPVREIKRRLAENIRKHKIDALSYGERKN